MVFPLHSVRSVKTKHPCTCYLQPQFPLPVGMSFHSWNLSGVPANTSAISLAVARSLPCFQLHAAHLPPFTNRRSGAWKVPTDAAVDEKSARRTNRLCDMSTDVCALRGTCRQWHASQWWVQGIVETIRLRWPTEARSRRDVFPCGCVRAERGQGPIRSFPA